MRENHEKEMQVQHEKHEKEKQVMRENHEKQIQVIQKQTDLIIAFTKIMHEVQRSMDQYVADIREYSLLKEKDDSWLSSLSRQEKVRLDQLEGFLETDEVIDVRMAITIVRQRFEQTKSFFSSQLEELEDTLDRIDVDKMKQLQKQINKKHLNAYLQKAEGQTKSEIMSMSRALQKPGVLSRIASNFYQSLFTVISKFIE